MKRENKKISHWLIMVGIPTMTGTNRESARAKMREMRKTHKDKDGYLYIGKCVKTGKHFKIVLEG